MLSNQKALFSLPENVAYLNGAYMSPQLKSVEQIGIENLRRKNHPFSITADDFFSQRILLKERFSALIGAKNPNNIAIIPSVSYGIANAAKNVKLEKGDEIILVDEQFPSNVYAWQDVAKQKGATIRLIKPPSGFENRGRLWNEAIANAINNKTAVVAMPHVHWADGTLFDLKTIREKTKMVGAKLIIDGTQSIGALPFYINEFQPDALICGGYKWLLGPYSLGVAYYNDTFNDGSPIEHSWLNRYQSEDFAKLVDYQDRFKEGAERYSVGESSNFIMVPMLTKAIEQLMEWKPENIQEYCNDISAHAVDRLRASDCFVEDDAFRAKHLFGVYLPKTMDLEQLKSRFTEKNIYVSFRGDAIRVSSNVYNTKADFDRLLSCF